MQCLCKVFMKHSCDEDLVTLLSRVTQQLKTYCTSRGEKQVDFTSHLEELSSISKLLFYR